MDEPDNVLLRGSLCMPETEGPAHVLQLNVGLGGDELITLRIFVPELTVSKVFQCHKEDIIWNVKQQCLAALPKELKEWFNYGLFSPPSNGRAGKFLDEERPLLDYAFHGPEAYLELKYKRRVYKMLNLDEKQLRALHTRVNLRRFLDYVTVGNLEKVTKMCQKGLDPNFHCQETGETPLAIAAMSPKSSPQLLMALVGGGALLDYRTKCGSTSLHRAAEKGRVEAVRTLLDLGASPNMRDGKGFTPLYLAVSCSAPDAVCRSLLYDHSIIGVTDSQGWQEVHQACRNGLVQHLENLLFYGADMNVRNASGNTPLHVCAVNNQEACARLLLFRGCFKDALNYANQTPFQVAVIAGNQNLAELISKFKEEEVVLFKEPPSYNSRRRKSGISRCYSKDFRISAPSTPSSSYSPHTPTQASVSHIIGSAVRVLPPLGSSGYGSISGSSSGVPPSPCPSERGWTENHALSTSSASSCTADSEDGGSANGSSITDKSTADQSDRVSDSSGVGTSHSGSAGSNDATPTETSLTISLYPEGVTVVCTEAYDGLDEGHLGLQPGDIIEVTGSTDDGFLEGRLRGMFGIFPPSHVQEVRLRNPYAIAAAQHHPMMGGSLGSSCSPLRMRTPSPSISNNERRDLLMNQFGTLQRVRRMFSEPRTVILHKGQRGFGFVLRGAKSPTPMRGASPQLDGRYPGLQYLESVDPGSVSDKAGLRTGDFLLAINGEDVSQASHESVVAAIQSSGNLVTMTVCSPLIQPEVISCSSLPPTPADQGPSRLCVTLPRKIQGRPPQPPRRDPRTTLSVGRAKAKSLIGGLAAMNAAENQRAEAIYATTDVKTASIRPRPSSARIVANEEQFRLGPAPVPPVQAPKHPRVYASVSAMKRTKKQKPAITSDTHLHRIFYSTPDLAWETDLGGSQSTLTPTWTDANSPENLLATPSGHASLPPDWRKSQSHENVTNIYALNAKNSRHSWAVTTGQKIERHYTDSWKDLEHSQTDETSESEDDMLTPVNDLSDQSPASVKSNDKCEDNLLGISEYRTIKPCRPVGGTLPRRMQNPVGPPPPTNPPPPVPPSQVVMVDVSKGCSEYASLTVLSPKIDKTAFSSFRPDGSKVYASPEKLGMLKKMQGTPATRSKSLPLRSPKPNIPVKNGDEMSASFNESRSASETPCQKMSSSMYDEPVKVTNELPFIPEPDYESDTEHWRKKESIVTPQEPVYTSRIQLRSPEITSPPRVVEEPLRPVSEGRKIFDAKARSLKEYKEVNESIYVSLVSVKPEDKQIRVSESSIETEAESDSSENTIMCRGKERRPKHEDSTSSSVSTLSSGSLPSDHIGTLEIPVKFDSDDVSAVKKLTENDIDNEIEKSLEMIRLHVSSIQDVQPTSPSRTSCLYRGGNPPLPPLPDYDEDTSPTEDFLPPPPAEFCDITSGRNSYAPTLPPPPTLRQLNDDFLRGRPKPKMERRLSEESFRPSARVVGIVPKKVSFHPEVTMCDSSPMPPIYGTLPTNFSRGYRMKAIEHWSVQDVCEWLDSISLSEYKASFSRHNISGDKLILLRDEDLHNIGVRNASHRIHVDKSLLRYRKE